MWKTIIKVIVAGYTNVFVLDLENTKRWGGGWDNNNKKK